MINYHRDIWPQRLHVLAPLSALALEKVKFEWTTEAQRAFDEMKRIIAQEILLTYPKFDEIFYIHMDASLLQSGTCILQNGKPIAFYSRKLNLVQTRYMTTERELLSIVEVLKEFRSIILGQQIRVYTDHENLTQKMFNSDRVMHWRLCIEEYSPDLQYIQGDKNVVAGTLSRLDMGNPNPEEALITKEMQSDWYCYAQEEKIYNFHPLSYQMLEKMQKANKQLMESLDEDKSPYQHLFFMGGGEQLDSLSAMKTK